MPKNLHGTENFYLKDKVALITGGGGGVGWGIGVEFARQGAQVVITDINEETGKQALVDLTKISDGHRFYFFDVRDIKAGRNLVEMIWSQYGEVDILVNNAGINTGHGFLDMTPEAWDKVLNTNLRGPMFFSQAVAEKMIENEVQGVILFITSVHHRKWFSNVLITHQARLLW